MAWPQPLIKNSNAARDRPLAASTVSVFRTVNFWWS